MHKEEEEEEKSDDRGLVVALLPPAISPSSPFSLSLSARLQGWGGVGGGSGETENRRRLKCSQTDRQYKHGGGTCHTRMAIEYDAADFYSSYRTNAHLRKRKSP